MSTKKVVLLSNKRRKEREFTSSIETRVSLNWKIERFSVRPLNTTIWSPPFKFLSSEWSLGLNTGDSYWEDYCSHVMFYLLMKNPKSETNVKGKICFNDRNGIDHCVKDFEYIFSAEKKEYSNFLIIRDYLFGEKQKELLYDDVLTVYCEISATQIVDVGVDPSTSYNNVTASDPVRVFFGDMEKLLQDQKGCDVTLRVGDQQFPAHKFLLGARSKVFAAMFEHDTEESRSGTVTITDIEVDVASDLLQYIYSAQLKDMSVDKAIGLYSAADKYALLDLKEQCADFLKENFSEESICDIAMMADAHNDGMLIDSIKLFIRENTSVLFSEEWKRLVEQNVLLAYEFSIALNKFFISGNSVPGE